MGVSSFSACDFWLLEGLTVVSLRCWCPWHVVPRLCLRLRSAPLFFFFFFSTPWVFFFGQKSFNLLTINYLIVLPSKTIGCRCFVFLCVKNGTIHNAILRCLWTFIACPMIYTYQSISHMLRALVLQSHWLYLKSNHLACVFFLIFF